MPEVAKEKRKSRNRKWWAENKTKTKEYGKSGSKKLKQWARLIEERYGITAEDYDDLYFKQNGVCAVCGKSDPRGIRLCVDHDHVHGGVRGLLCHHCNSAIGFLGDNPKILASAIKYLEKRV